VSEKSQITKERLYFEEKKGGSALGLMKEVAGHQKSKENYKHQKKK
jgi:hypothetical protein